MYEKIHVKQEIDAEVPEETKVRHCAQTITKTIGARERQLDKWQVATNQEDPAKHLCIEKK